MGFGSRNIGRRLWCRKVSDRASLGIALGLVSCWSNGFQFTHIYLLFPAGRDHALLRAENAVADRDADGLELFILWVGDALVCIGVDLVNRRRFLLRKFY